ncbi:MAG: glycoside hydrolase family 16, partial [Aeromicrobium sp.]
MTSGIREDFDDGLDAGRWLPHYLPQWSSRAESAATWEVEDSALVLSIPSEQGRWCAETHDGPLRVSGVQSGCFSGPVGSTVGQQPFAPGLVVREEQPLRTGWTWAGGLLEVRARMELSTRSMASVWMIGLEDAPERCG